MILAACSKLPSIGSTFNDLSPKLKQLIPIILVFAALIHCEASAERVFSRTKFSLSKLKSHYGVEGFMMDIFVLFNHEPLAIWGPEYDKIRREEGIKSFLTRFEDSVEQDVAGELDSMDDLCRSCALNGLSEV